MRSTTLRLMSVALVAGLAIVGLAAPSQADTVTYSTTGIFTGGDAPGTNQYIDAANGILITFEDVLSNSVNVPPDSQATFGTFNSTGTTAATLTGVSSGFELTILQTTPSTGDVTFLGTLQGQLASDNSQAFVLFNSPLTEQINNGNGTQTVYRIIEADNGTTGRANISPPSSNAGRSTVEGIITLSGQFNTVPEPSSILMASLAVPALLLYGRSRKIKATA